MNPTTCVRYAAALALVAATSVHADAFSAADKALWIDRHNYFRMTAVPFAAANMLRIKWSDELATQAQTDAATCAASGTGAGVNVALVAAVAGAVDASFTEWVVTPALAAFPKLAAPKAAGDAVGQGTYNSYSQVVWSSTNQVGCAYAACTGGKIGVACRYAPAGNDGTSPWYVHGPAGSACPAGTVSKVGLCVTSADDPSYNDIAPIAAGQNAYDVFKDFIPNMQKALKGEAVAPAPAPAPASESTATPGATTAAPAAAGNATTTPVTTAPASAGGNTTQTTTTAPPTATTTPSTTTVAPSSGTSDGTAPAPTVTKVVDGKVYVKVLPTTTPSTGGGSGSSAGGAPAAGGATPAPTVTKVVDGKVYVKVVPGTGSTAGASEPTVGDATPAPTVTKVVNGVVYVKVDKDKQGDTVGTVKPGSGTGSTFTNQASNKPASAASTPASTDATAIGANNKSGGNAAGEASFSAAGVAGIIVIGCVAIAGVAVFVSYRKNQQRQRDIMQNGGIHVL